MAAPCPQKTFPEQTVGGQKGGHLKSINRRKGRTQGLYNYKHPSQNLIGEIQASGFHFQMQKALFSLFPQGLAICLSQSVTSFHASVAEYCFQVCYFCLCYICLTL